MKVLLAGLLILPCLSGAFAADPPPAGSAADHLAGLQRWLDERPHLHASFRQSLVSGALGTGLVESGELWLRRPGQMRWEYRDPEYKLALVVDRRTWLYLQEDQQLILGLLDDEASLLPRLLASETRLQSLFVATPMDLLEGDDGLGILLLPSGVDEAFEEVRLVLDPRTFAVREARITDSGGNRMLYTFEGWEPDPGSSDPQFRFEPPAGTEVVGSHEP
ncbi:MAG: outer membrane lipoprotein carrier protein LolA [Acidobacteriota bacterium]|nr:outer membrane lipoprotein carrier protein LolA [Acidobacteriota bacterium]MDH3785500.1 outer membrane lipoprotein carrier protein LolA [Acidobacteriota bacterium]